MAVIAISLQMLRKISGIAQKSVGNLLVEPTGFEPATSTMPLPAFNIELQSFGNTCQFFRPSVAHTKMVPIC